MEPSLNLSPPAIAKRDSGRTNICAYLVLRRNSQVLLGLRQNTSYCDGYYGLVSGHVENGEAATAGMIREAYEEAGIELLPSQLRLAHIMHRKTARLNMDLFFECTTYGGSIVNQEPDKCAELTFFPLDRLPLNTVDYVAEALWCIARGQIYSERGWDSP